MNIESIKRKTERLNKSIKNSTIISSLCVVTAVSLFVPAFMKKGNITDYVSFCFQPKEIHDPYIYKERINKLFAIDSNGKYIIGKNRKKKIITKKTKVIIGKRFCNEKTIRRGIKYLIAEEFEESLQFKSKVKVLKTIKATNSNAGLFGMASGLILFVGGCIYGLATQDLEDNLDSLIHVKRSQMIKDALSVEQDLQRESHDAEIETAYIKKGIEEALKFKYLGDDLPMPEEEIIKRQQEIEKHESLRDTSIELELADMKAKIAENKKKEAEHLKELNRINKPIKDKIRHESLNKEDSNKEAKDDLIQRLKDHEDGWLWTIIKSIKPLWISGDQGSGKSTMAVSIALCRHYLLNHKIETIIDPEFNKNLKTKWSYLISFEPKTYGEILDPLSDNQSEWIDVNQGLIDCLDRWRIEDETSKLKTTILDEVTQYSSNEECKKTAAKFIPALISKPRKANEGVICIAHLISNNATGGSEGYASGIKAGSFIVNLRTENDAVPLFKGTIEGYKDNDGNVIKEKIITVPKDWFNPKSIKEMFR